MRDDKFPSDDGVYIIQLPVGTELVCVLKCPLCGLSMGEELENTESNKGESDSVKCDAGEACSPGVTGCGSYSVNGDGGNPHLNWMIDPFSYAPKEASEGNNGCRRWRNGSNKPCNCQDKNKGAGGDHNFIPFIKRKFREWMLNVHSPSSINKESIDYADERGK